MQFAITRKPLALIVVVFGLALSFACLMPRVAHAAGLVIAPAGSSDVKTIRADTLVYRGGTYDFIVEAEGFTAKSYQWWMKFYDMYEHSIDYTMDGEEDPTWFSGFNTNHLKFCTNNFVSDSEHDDWGAFEFYCIVTDTNGKKHYSDTFQMEIKGTNSFNAKYADREAAGYGLAIASTVPARGSDGMTEIEMELGQSQTFSFTVNNGVKAWLSESDPVVKTTIEVLAAGQSMSEKHPGVTSWTFKPEKAGEYLVYMGANLQLGYNYDTGKGDGHYYLVNVKEPTSGSSGTEPDPDEVISSITGSNCSFTIEAPWVFNSVPAAGAEIPDVSMKVPTSYYSQLAYSIAWYRQVGAGWETCEALGDTTFNAGCAYQLRATFVAADGYRLKSNLHGTPTTLKTAIEFEGRRTDGTGYASLMGKSYLPMHSYSSKAASYVLREYSVEEALSAPSSSEFSSKAGFASVADAVVEVADVAFTGQPLTPSPSVKLGSKTLVADVDYTIAYSNNKNIGKASVTIKGVGDYTGQVIKDFKINPAAVAWKKLKSASKAFTASWKKASGVSGYQVQYSLKKNFKKATTKTVKKPSAKKLKVKKLKSKKRYYVRIRAYKVVNGAMYYGAWSKTKKVKTR